MKNILTIIYVLCFSSLGKLSFGEITISRPENGQTVSGQIEVMLGIDPLKLGDITKVAIYCDKKLMGNVNQETKFKLIFDSKIFSNGFHELYFVSYEGDKRTFMSEPIIVNFYNKQNYFPEVSLSR